MTTESLSRAQLEAYLDETVSAVEAARIESVLREDPALLDRLKEIAEARDSGVHSLGAIWRRHRLACPTREQLGSFLLEVLPREEHALIAFHLDVVGCRFCQANLHDMQAARRESPDHAQSRRQRYFQSSAGYLRRSE